MKKCYIPLLYTIRERIALYKHVYDDIDGSVIIDRAKVLKVIILRHLCFFRAKDSSMSVISVVLVVAVLGHGTRKSIRVGESGG